MRFGRLLGALGRLLLTLGRLLDAALEASPFKLGTVGHQFDVSPVCCEKVLWDLDWQCEGFVAQFCLILDVLGRLLTPCELPGNAFGYHFGSLGASWGAKLGQDDPR